MYMPLALYQMNDRLVDGWIDDGSLEISLAWEPSLFRIGGDELRWTR